MAEARTNRRLAAILAADVVGYSRLMAADEAGTLAALKRHRETVFDPAVADHGGRIVKLIGDGALVEFGSVVDAVNCALALQRVPDPLIRHRIGINLGDVIVDGDDIYGDGVNVAARLEPLADSGGICVSAIVNESVGSRVEATFTDAGEVTVKNINRPIRIWKWSPAQDHGKVVVAPPSPPASGPSIAVLPFMNMSADAEQEYFCDGITEDIITDLSKVPGLLVIARNSSFVYKGRVVDIPAVARDLRVKSVLEGSIRRTGNRVRVTAQLIDGATGGHLWAERFDRDLTDIFTVQDEVTREIVAALKITLGPEGLPATSESGTTSVEAQDAYFRGNALLASPHLNRDVLERATSLLLQALEHDPNYGRALAALSIAYVNDFTNGWSEDSANSLQVARRYAEEAVQKSPNDAHGHAAYALVLQIQKDTKGTAAEVDRALQLNPNHPMAITIRAMINVSEGNALAAIPLLERALRLDPAWSQGYLQHLGTVNLLAGKYETAATLFRERLLIVPESDLARAGLAVALGHLGQVEEARRIWAELTVINPVNFLEEHLSRMPFTPAQVEVIRTGLSRAGLSG